jgi:UDP:flavonoid glycosyltransferase YjiC (YdhE family)
MIMHTMQRYWRDQWSLRSPMGWWLRFQRLHPARRRPDLAVVTTLRDLDRGPEALPCSVQVGPILGPLGAPSSCDRKLPVLVSFSTISYPDQQQVVQRVLYALARLPVRAVVTNPTGLERLTIPPNVRVQPFVPHDELMPNVRAVICHGGHGTTMMALAHGLPVLVVPLTRHADHELVGQMVEEAGVGTMRPKHSDTAVLAAAITRLLAVDPQRIERVQHALRSTDSATAAARSLERLL